MPLFGLGVLILWLGWFGFNPGSTLNALDGRFPEIAARHAARGRRRRARRDHHRAWKTESIDIGMAGNGAIAALVAITAPSGYVELWTAPIIGGVAGLIVPLCIYAIDKKIDDPVGALSAHGIAGIWGTISCGLFTAPRLAKYNGFGDAGLIYTGSFHQLAVQALGVVVVFAFVFVALLRHVLGDQEDVRPARVGGGRGRRTGHLRARHVRVPGAVHPGARARGLRGPRPAGRVTSRAGARPPGGPGNMKKVEAFVRHEAFEPIRTELLELGFPSLSISEVKGSGRQKGITERYRGAELTNYLRPKVKVECVVASGDVQTVVDTILKHARTGSIGDGKVFVMPVEEAYRIRTGESGEETLQAHPDFAAQANA